MAEYQYKAQLLKIAKKIFKEKRNEKYEVHKGLIKNYPYRYVLACLMDRQIKAEKAWEIPTKLDEHFGINSFEKEKPHRFNTGMAEIYNLAIKRIDTEYDGKAEKIWVGATKALDVMYKFFQFKGAGKKISRMACILLYSSGAFPKEFDTRDLDIAVDVHVRRVIGKIGLVPENIFDEYITYKARELSPEFPALLDVFYDVGKEWCKARNRTDCVNCELNSVCLSAKRENYNQQAS